MNLLFLRGQVDCRTQKVKKLDEHHDMYTQLAFAMCGPEDRAMMMYYGGKRRFIEYDWNHYERWEPDFKGCSINVPFHNRDGFADFIPSVVMCRGGFSEYDNLVDRLPRSVVKVRYGAGKRIYPRSENEYDILLADSHDQVRKIKRRFPKANVELFFKPAAPYHFRPMPVEKKYDVCFVAAVPQDKRKRVNWVWKTCPRSLKVLQLGLPIKGAPENVKIKHVPREKMAYYMNQCKLLIAPYNSEDSCPRVISEALACGIPVLTREDTAYWDDKYSIVGFADKRLYWNRAKELMKEDLKEMILDYYKNNLTIKHAAIHLRTLIEKARVAKQL